jgi:hypothetical protein
MTCITLLTGLILCTGAARPLDPDTAAAMVAPRQYVPVVRSYPLPPRSYVPPAAATRPVVTTVRPPAARSAPWFIDGIYVGESPSGQWTSTIHVAPTVNVRLLPPAQPR